MARLYGLARTTVARHREHVAPLEAKFGVIRAPDGPPGPGDPLEEAFALAERSRTPRERLRALEQVRAATRLKLRGAENPDPEAIGLLDANIVAAESAFRDAGDFETAARGLSGWREAITQRIDAIRHPDSIEVPLVLTHADGTPLDGQDAVQMSPATYWAGVPQRFRDPSRFVVHRTIELRFGQARSRDAGGKLEVRERANGALVWAR